MITSSSQHAWEGLTPSGPMVRPKAAAAYLGLSMTSFYRLVNTGEIPLVKISGRASGVPSNHLDAVIRDRFSKSVGTAGDD